MPRRETLAPVRPRTTWGTCGPPDGSMALDWPADVARTAPPRTTEPDFTKSRREIGEDEDSMEVGPLNCRVGETHHYLFEQMEMVGFTHPTFFPGRPSRCPG